MLTEYVTRSLVCVLLCLSLSCSPDKPDDPGAGPSKDGGVGPDATGETVCRPNEASCDGDTSQVCLPDGSGYVQTHCDPIQDVQCNFETGRCQGACAPDNLGFSYIGCEYYPTVTSNLVDNAFHFAVAISNASDEPANVTIEGGALGAPLVVPVQPGEVRVQQLPWVELLKGRMFPVSALERKGAYHLRSTRPVTVYQFSPLEYVLPDLDSFTNDASLLLPVNALRDEYVAVAWPMWNYEGAPSPGLVAVTATADNTLVTINTTADTAAYNDAPAFTAGVSQTVPLDAGDVLQLLNHSGDLTGTQVGANQPVQVIAGHYCTRVPTEIPACDHLEESMFPVRTLSNRYLVTAAKIPHSSTPKIRVIRIVTMEPNTTLQYDPPQDAATFVPIAGGMVELYTNEDFEVHADHRIIVAQYMAGMDAGGDTGDPAMTLAVGVEQFREDYLFHSPLSYEDNFVNIIAPAGATIELDGRTVTGFDDIGDSGYAVARVEVDDDGNGNHRVSGDAAFGVSAYGYGDWTSYWYPGGLDLEPIDVE